MEKKSLIKKVIPIISTIAVVIVGRLLYKAMSNNKSQEEFQEFTV